MLDEVVNEFKSDQLLWWQGITIALASAAGSIKGLSIGKVRPYQAWAFIYFWSGFRRKFRSQRGSLTTHSR